MYARLQDSKENSVAFPIWNGVKKECILAPTLFSIMFSAIRFDAFSGSVIGMDIRYRTDGSVINLGRFQAKTKGKTDIVNGFLFADDSALNVTNKVLTCFQWPVTTLAWIKVKLVTIVEGDQKAPYSIATPPRCTGRRYSFFWITPLYLWYVPYITEY